MSCHWKTKICFYMFTSHRPHEVLQDFCWWAIELLEKRLKTDETGPSAFSPPKQRKAPRKAKRNHWEPPVVQGQPTHQPVKLILFSKLLDVSINPTFLQNHLQYLVDTYLFFFTKLSSSSIKQRHLERDFAWSHKLQKGAEMVLRPLRTWEQLAGCVGCVKRSADCFGSLNALEGFS